MTRPAASDGPKAKNEAKPATPKAKSEAKPVVPKANPRWLDSIRGSGAPQQRVTRGHRKES